MNLENRLKELREQHKYTQDDVAGFLNISRQSVSKWEQGKGYPDIDNLRRLSDLYKISLDQLITGEEKYHTPVASDSNKSDHKTVGDFLWRYWWLVFPMLGMISSWFYYH
ncbi:MULTISPECIES: helix-turn-helix transcriptional regulator [unclassified Lysinibacillus]|uniref:helix-turn-helix transcriptional regulator n=1 Tax=unclassified Lysinibacillus TaxID=2636778 RepID=UPI0020110D12|nr:MULTISPECIES: helix-turn-helix transcriptional regulator [unclassified Lysinibacillus]MCL1695644.1 helix-turn-helix domain-containing protein [Lysinibacillus sp. BPa_S21]MCL1700111.1 helix-turn-helix domain-containing protein [Lysinibacillus sp. Bpr_S20]